MTTLSSRTPTPFRWALTHGHGRSKRLWSSLLHPPTIQRSRQRGIVEASTLPTNASLEEDSRGSDKAEGAQSGESVLQWQERMERRYKYEDITRQLYTSFEALHAFHHQRAPDTNTNRATTTADMMRTQFGFALVKRRSTIPDAGHGLFLEGAVSEGTCVCIYPGAVYQPGDPLLLPSLRNDYLIRRSDGSSVDGRPRGLSRYFYRSIYEKFGPFAGLCDATWLDIKEGGTNEHNPFGWGHLINHSDVPNVMYFEYQFPPDTPAHYLSFIPNVFYSSKDPACAVKTVVLMAMRRIRDEELFSNYNFIGRATPGGRREDNEIIKI